MTDAVMSKTTGAEQIVWDLSIFYSDVQDPAIERDMAEILALADAYAEQYRGRVADLSAQQMLAAIETGNALRDKAGRIGTFAFLNFATDTANPAIGALVQKYTEFDAVLSQKTLFFELEWKALSDDAAEKFLADPILKTYRHLLESERRYKPHMLSEAEEQLLLDKGVTSERAWTRFFTQLTSAMRYEFQGRKVTQSEILKQLYHPEREIRKQAADSVTASLRDKSMELTYIFNVLVADKAANDKRRNFPSWISERNLDNKAPDEVVEALVSSITSQYELVARHYRLKRTLLGLDELYHYDRYAPLPIPNAERDYSWDEARQLVHAAYSRFSKRAGSVVDKFFADNWIHAALLPNKRGGAFASPSVPSAHPFVLVNYTGKTRDVMTLAHELGHGLHMYLGGEANQIQGLYTPLTTAEMASTFGEMLVFDDLMAAESNPEAQLGLLAGKIEDSFATIFRQTAMNRFENRLHTERRAQGELNGDQINSFWLETQRAMFGDSVTLGDDYGLWWSYIPHFVNTPGYVYAYAFGELLVLALFNLYKQQGDAFVPKYLDVLAAGNTDYPEQILRKVGVELGDPNFWNQGLAILGQMVSQEEALARKVYPAKFA